MTMSAPLHPTRRLWESFDDVVSQRSRIMPLFGVPDRLADDFMALAVLRSGAARAFFDGLDDTINGASHATTIRSERCVGNVRGAIQWSETITAWSNGIGVNDVFVCSVSVRDYDVSENRLVVWLLSTLADGVRTADPQVRNWFGGGAIAEINLRNDMALAYLDHRRLRDVARRRPSARDIRSARMSRQRRSYRTAVDLYEGMHSPLADHEVHGLSSSDTTEHHRVFGLLMDAMAALGLAVPLLRTTADMVTCGPIRYRQPDTDVDRRATRERGLFVGDIRIATAVDDDRVWDDDRQRVIVRTLDDAVAVIAATRTTVAADATGAAFQNAAPMY